jgi:hypothetical protein
VIAVIDDEEFAAGCAVVAIINLTNMAEGRLSP